RPPSTPPAGIRSTLDPTSRARRRSQARHSRLELPTGLGIQPGGKRELLKGNPRTPLGTILDHALALPVHHPVADRHPAVAGLAALAPRDLHPVAQPRPVGRTLRVEPGDDAA